MFKKDKNKKITSYIKYGLNSKLEDWNYYLDSFMGGNNYKKAKYLYSPSHELKDDYKDRLKFSDYINYCRNAINNYSIPIYSKLIIRKGIDSILNNLDFKDLQGNIITPNKFFMYWFEYLNVFGEIFVRLDYPFVKEGSTEYDTIGYKFSLNLELPLSVMDYEINKDGFFEYVIIKKSFVNDKGRIENKYCVYSNENITYIYNKNDSYETIETKFSSYITPIYRSVLDFDNDGFGDSLLSQIVDTNRLIYNLNSFVWKYLNQDTFASCLMPTDQTLIQHFKQYYNEKDGIVDFSIKDIMTYPAGSDKPSYLEKPLTGIDKIETFIEKKEKDIDRITNQFLQRALFNQSGVSKAFDYQKQSDTLKQLAEYCESQEKMIFGFIAPLMGIELDDFRIEYNKDFNIYDKEQRLNITKELIDEKKFGYSPAFVQYAFEEVFLKDLYDNKIDKKMKEQIIKELGEENNKEVEVTEEVVKINEIEEIRKIKEDKEIKEIKEINNISK